MATHYSEHYAAASTATVSPPTSLPATRTRAPTGHAGVPVKVKRAYMDFGAAGSRIAAADTFRFFPLRSGDRITALRLTTEASTWTDTTAALFNLGLYSVGALHDGTALDIDLFVNDLDITGAIADLDAFDQATTLTGHQRGLPLWELLAVGEGSDTTDPFLDYDVVGTFADGPTTDEGIIMLECEYLPGGRN